MSALIVFHVQDPAGQPLGGALLSSVGGPGPWQGMTNACGDFHAQLAPAHYDITISHAGFATRLLPADLGDCGIVTIGLDHGNGPSPQPPNGGTLPALHAEGQHFRAVDGSRVTLIGCSDFNLFGRFLNGEDIQPVLDQRQAAGFNALRVWTRYQLSQYGIGDCTLSAHPDLYDRIPSFLSACAASGYYVELTAYTGREDFAADHWQRIGDACQGALNVLLELVNENDQAGNHIDVTPFSRHDGILCSHGSNGSQATPVTPYWDYATFHTNGAPEEQRKVGHNGMELWSGPTWTNETSRFPDAGGMWADGDATVRAFDAAAGAALLAAGSTFHSVNGKNSTLWDDTTFQIAKAWCDGARSVDLACQDGPYTHRTDLEGPHDLRVYERPVSGHSCIVRIRK